MTTDNGSESWLGKVYGAKDVAELEAAYDGWAQSYDGDLLAMGYRNPAVAAGMVARYVRPDSGCILDAGAGTGLIGEVLSLLGYRDLVAIDISQDMLDIARARGVYDEARQMVLGERLDFPDDEFSAVVSMGVMTVGHAPPDCLDELVRVVHPGGHLIFSISDPVFFGAGYKDKILEIDGSGRWRMVEKSAPFVSLPDAPDESERLFATIYVYQVL